MAPSLRKATAADKAALKSPPAPAIEPKPGADAPHIESITTDENNLATVTMKDGTKLEPFQIHVKDGESIKGEPGESIKGEPGPRGNFVTDLEVDKGSKNFRLVLEDGFKTPWRALGVKDGASIKGEPGESIKGEPGESIKGEPGEPGADAPRLKRFDLAGGNLVAIFDDDSKLKVPISLTSFGGGGSGLSGHLWKKGDDFAFLPQDGLVQGSLEVRDFLKLTVPTDGSPPVPTDEGIIFWDKATHAPAYRTNISGVTNNIGQELHQQVVNNTGVLIPNGTPVRISGAFEGLAEVTPADAVSVALSANTRGLVTADIPAALGSRGILAPYGDVRDLNTDMLIEGRPVYLAVGGGYTTTRPVAPNNIVVLGGVLVKSATEGKIFVGVQQIERNIITKSYSFTSNGIGAGTYYAGGFYDFNPDDANLTQASPTVSYGTISVAYAAHAGIVPSGPGVVTGGGQVGLRINGTAIDDAGNRTPGDSQILTDDITSLAQDVYREVGKFNGTIEFELYVVSGAPTAYSLDFNYGYAKYEDLGNVDFTIYAVEAVGLAGANDTNFNIELMFHKAIGWTYADTGFIPGNSDIANWSEDMAPEDNLGNGTPFAWKRTDLFQFVDGDGPEGIMFRLTTGANNSVQSMDMHVSGFVE